jgi:hypothetical protein
VLWDRYAQRWVLTEFSSSGNNLCFYISRTEDPITGGWHHYGFTAPNFPDYPKYAVWPTDANGGQGSYIVTTNESGPPAAYAMDRGAMLVGDPASFQRVTFTELPGFSFESTTPADPDGPEAPASGDPAIIMRQRDTENHGGPPAPGDLLEMWTWQVDWNDAANSLLAQEASIDVAEFDSDLCGLTAFFCFPQPDSSTTLDPLREVIMWRLQYMNHDDHETLMGNFVTDLDGTDHGGLRWFELRRTGGGAWSLHQEGTYSIDADHRWMAASAMDQSGNIAIAYNVSSTSTYPSLRYTGRLADDPSGVMSQPETPIHDGTSPNSSNRYGDYSAMSLDPADDCTFWFTGMDNTSTSWRTQIASFKFDLCGCLLAPDPPTTFASVPGDNRIELSWGDSELETVVEYQVLRSRISGGPYEKIAVVPDSSPGLPNGPGYVYEDATVSGGITYYYVIVASDGETCKSDRTNEVSATATGACTLAPLFAGVQSVTMPFLATCTLDLEWNGATPECGGPVTYNVYRSTTQGFTPHVGNLLIGGLAGTTYRDEGDLDWETRYYYVVRAVDQANGVEESNLVEDSGTPKGELTTGTWFDDAGDTDPAKMITESPWQIDLDEGHGGPRVYKTGAYGNSLCSGLFTPLRLGTGSVLTFWSKHEIESSWDKGEVQISTDGGLVWERVEMAYPAESTHASDACGLPIGFYFTGTNLTWRESSADLSAWANQDVLLRFVLSTDGSVNGQGWWIDDITVTNVEVPGECVVGACDGNPLVDIDPSGPLSACAINSPVLMANTTGGIPPFEYQWLQDGQIIPGENSSTFVPTATGSHLYNVTVKADTCNIAAEADLPTQVTLVDRPAFDGIQSVLDSQQSACMLSLGWDAATSICDGPLQYFVYRDSSSPVSPSADKMVASGLGGTTYDDSAGLVDGQTYYYLVRSMDRSTAIFDDNVTEASGTPTGVGSGAYDLLSEDFESPAALDDWTVTTGPDVHTCGEWARSIDAEKRPGGGSGYYALADNRDCNPVLGRTSTTLTSPLIDTALAGLVSATLEFDLMFDHDGNEIAAVEVFDGSSWVAVWNDGDTDVDQHFVIDVTAWAAGNPSFQVRFDYQNAMQDMWMSVDNVVLHVDVFNPCTTSIGPVPVPDGSGSTAPLLGERLSVSGDTISFSWDATSCTANSYDLLYGDLANVATYALDGSICSIGTSGGFTWNGVPGGDLYFLVVGSDGQGTESSWGLDDVGTERNGMTASGECSNINKEIASTCP